MVASFVHISHCFFSSEDGTVYSHKALLKCLQAALETVEKQQEQKFLQQCWPVTGGWPWDTEISSGFCATLESLVMGQRRMDQFLPFLARFLSPKWFNWAFSSQWKLRVMLLNSSPCVSCGARAGLIQEKEFAIPWLYGVIQSWYLTHGL